MEFSRCGNFRRRLLGVQSSRLGRLLGLGSRRKLVARAVAYGCRVVALGQPCAKKIRRADSSTRRRNVHLRAGRLRNFLDAFGHLGRLFGSLIRKLDGRRGNRFGGRSDFNRRADVDSLEGETTSARHALRITRRTIFRGTARQFADNFRRGDCLGRNVNAVIEPTRRRGGGGRHGFLRQKHGTNRVGVDGTADLHLREIRADDKSRRKNRACRLRRNVGGNRPFVDGRHGHAGTQTSRKTSNRRARSHLRRSNLQRRRTRKVLRLHGRWRSCSGLDETAR